MHNIMMFSSAHSHIMYLFKCLHKLNDSETQVNCFANEIMHLSQVVVLTSVRISHLVCYRNALSLATGAVCLQRSMFLNVVCVQTTR